MEGDKTAAPGRLLGFWMCLALVIGNIIGAGVFLLPTALAPFGPNAIYGWLLTIAGMLCNAWVLAQLASRLDGGPYAYARAGLGPFAAFVMMWGYWISIWTGSASLATAAVSYLSRIAPALDAPVVAPSVACGLVWLMTLVNARGARTAGFVQLGTTILKLVPLFAVVAVALWLVGRGDAPTGALADVAVTPGAIASVAALSIFSMLGIESATLPAGKVRDPKRTVPRATVIGAAIAGLVYLFACSAVLLLLPADKAISSPAPFADAVAIVAGDGAGLFIAGFAVLSAVGALNGWVLCSGEVPLGLARDGLFPRWFGKTVGPAATPIRAQVVASACASILVVSNYAGSMAKLFAFMTLISTVATVFLYLICAVAALMLIRRRALSAPMLLPAAIIGVTFNIWAFWGAGAEATAWGFGLMLTGLPAYALIRWENQPTGATAGR